MSNEPDPNNQDLRPLVVEGRGVCTPPPPPPETEESE